MPHEYFGLERVFAESDELLLGTKLRRNRMFEGQNDGEGTFGRITRQKNEPED